MHYTADFRGVVSGLCPTTTTTTTTTIIIIGSGGGDHPHFKHHILNWCSLLQPAFVVAIFAPVDNNEDQLNTGDAKLQSNETSLVPLVSKKSSLLDALMLYIERADDLINRCSLWRKNLSIFIYLFTNFWFLCQSLL